ncbi:unannotated protein [freshwater metagenome]|jgi:HPt (histidine-containing phosphotransfer) domain-containing protein|uniref:Unannotated protein n=1 Tax=freshwater metagenome TaxID=449393 RepID=A0A6J7BP34_9ZZZZ|nr:hypothetical protein [Actinomycetota bacterium]MSW36810.1 hypothetical protein [Actinomycetota bacterium]MSX37594.1 hypothetical protein [Actinomycetota bacterium]
MPPKARVVLDTARLDSLVEEIGSRDLVLQAIQAFLDELPDRLITIRTSLATEDSGLIRGAAHALGSPASMLGAVAVAARTRTLSDAVAEGKRTGLHRLVDAILIDAEVTAADMRAYLASDRPV